MDGWRNFIISIFDSEAYSKGSFAGIVFPSSQKKKSRLLLSWSFKNQGKFMAAEVSVVIFYNIHGKDWAVPFVTFVSVENLCFVMR